MRNGERDSLFGSIRLAVSGVANIISTATGSISTITEVGAQYLNTSMNSLVDDAKHNRTIKVVENAKQVKDLGVDVKDISDYLSLRDMILDTLDEVYEPTQSKSVTTQAKANPRKNGKANETVAQA